MSYKPTPSRFSRPAAARQSGLEESWHSDSALELHLYAQSLRAAAKSLLGRRNPNLALQSEWDAGPILLLYRQALELHLKAVVCEGRGFLKTPTDSITLSNTHSLRWLSQIVRQIINAVGWQRDFTCSGIASLPDFMAKVEELDNLDPIKSLVFTKDKAAVAQKLQIVVDPVFISQTEALLDLLDSSADALAAATADLQADPRNGTIQ